MTGLLLFCNGMANDPAYEAMKRIRKGHIHGVEKREVKCQVMCIATLYNMGASAEQDAIFYIRRIRKRGLFKT